jgi:hypothetical protein
MNKTQDTTHEMAAVAEVKETLPLLRLTPMMGWRNRLRIAHKGSSSSSDAEVPAHHDEKRAKSVPAKNPPDSVTKSTTSTSTSASTQTLPKPKKKVHFSDVHVRIYNRILGDNPYVEIPLSIGWEYSVEEPSSVEDHQARQFEPDYANASGMEPMEQEERMQKLESVGIPKDVIRRGERRRKIQIVEEWTYRMDPTDVTPCTCHYGQILIQRYLMA